jgi:cell division protein FtsI (penicillin-binding protein 3)
LSDAHAHLSGYDQPLPLEPRGSAPRVQIASRMQNGLEIGRSRLGAAGLAFGFAFLAIAVGAVKATILSKGAEPLLFEASSLRATQSGRADIVDRNGVVLATSLATQSLFVDPKLVIEPADAVQKLKTVLPHLNAPHLLAELASDKRFVWIERNLTPRQQYEVNRLGVPGLGFQREERRVYPQGNLAAHVVGLTGVDNNGLMGVEQRFDSRLRQDNTPLSLSIDVRLQHILRKEIGLAMEEFRAVGGAGMVMDVKTGELLGMVSLPDFDPHNPPPAFAPEDQDLDPRFNRNTLGVYEMGSTFKIFNTAMALESGRVRLSDSFDATHSIRIGRFTISDFHPENRWMDVPDIFKHSSNIGSVRMAEIVGPAGQKEFMTKLGFARPVSLELPETGWPMIPNPWREVNMMTIAFGHGMSISPVHLVTAVSGVVNGGLLHPVTLLKRPDGEEIPGTRIVSQRTSDTLRKLMRLVVTDGTATRAEAAGYLVGGKTGTAEKVKGRSYSGNARISSFVGAFPMNDPRYVIYIMIDEPKPSKNSFGYATGGWVAAPAIGRIITQIGPLLGVQPQDPQSPALLQAMAVYPQAGPHTATPPVSQLAAIPAASGSGRAR